MQSSQNAIILGYTHIYYLACLVIGVCVDMTAPDTLPPENKISFREELYINPYRTNVENRVSS